MSEATDILQAVVSDRETLTGDAVWNLRTGKSFVAEIESIQDIELNTELGRDARETVLIHIGNRAAAAEQQINDRLKCTLFGVTTTVQIVRRKDDPTDPQVEFGCMKIVPGKDA